MQPLESPASPPTPAKERVLIVDDDEVTLKILQSILQRGGIDVVSTRSGPEALQKISSENFSLILTDIRMEGSDGFQILDAVQATSPSTPVMLMTAYAEPESVLKALRQGATDYIQKPCGEEVLPRIKACLELSSLRVQNVRLRRTLNDTFNPGNLQEYAPSMRKLFLGLREVIPLTCHVLITGESGTGKELIAKAIHFSGPRAEKPFIAINCGAMPENLLESELFGHVRGAFTDARSDKRGLVSAAEGGTLFLDEIAEMSPHLQVKLLRLLQNLEYRPVGGTITSVADIRVLAATNKDLHEEVKRGRFREDLYFRLNVVEFHLAPLTERRMDIPFLAKHFVERFAKKHGKPPVEIAPEAMKALVSYPWPGNVRELENILERAVIFSKGPTLGLKAFSTLVLSRAQTTRDESLENHLSLDEYARRLHERLKDLYGQDEIAHMLGISRKSLWLYRQKWAKENGGRSASPETKVKTRGHRDSSED